MHLSQPYYQWIKVKLVVYTAIFGSYDKLIDPEIVSPDIDYVCFTDQPLHSDVWDIRHVPATGNTTLQARGYKLLPHIQFPDHDVSIWCDGSCHPVDMSAFAEQLQDADMFAFDHGRDCIYKEGEACIQHKKDDPAVIKAQMRRYAKDGYPQNNGLIATGMIIRKHNDPDMIRLHEAWYEEVIRGSIRDQLSFNYCLSKYPINLRVIPFGKHKQWFKWRKHGR